MAGLVANVLASQLGDQLVDVRRSLRRRPIPKDGHCQFRGVASQCPAYGYSRHARLRSDVVIHVEEHREHFMPFFHRQPATAASGMVQVYASRQMGRQHFVGG